MAAMATEESKDVMGVGWGLVPPSRKFGAKSRDRQCPGINQEERRARDFLVNIIIMCM